MIIALQTLIFFRESLITVLDRILRPYYKSLFLSGKDNRAEDEDSEDQVFAEFDDEKGVVFYPPVYVQRYAAVTDCLMDERWCGKLEKVVDFGYHDMSFIRYLKEVPGIKNILGVDIESIPLRCSSDLLNVDNYVPKRENPLQIVLYQGNAADPDYRLIGCDAVVAIEMIEHMLPHDLQRFVHTVFGFIKPWLAIFTTPNGDFNSLFKALEKNGLRRLDHFFEWSQEQFHEWCSNIVIRYPQYTVTCKGIGPGPPGTIHLGCCSQLALFVAKDYHKQLDLNLNSLALVAKNPSLNTFSEIDCSVAGLDSVLENNMICAPNDVLSFTELLISDHPSCMTYMITSTSFSTDAIEYQDKVLQCNLDTEQGKSFLMFDEEPYCNIVMPRRQMTNKVYEIEDVASRLNCSTLQVKKFSKTTQNVIAKNKLDTLAHTREVVGEIRHLTKMLNFNKNSINKYGEGCIWQNFNWGENAPYWNQYYKIVREFNYPFETKSEECRILDLITEEINRLIDNDYDEDFSTDPNKLEIPIDYLMRVVEHLTNDVEKVKELLEWNGYEVVDDVVIHSRLIIDTTSEITKEDDWQETEILSDWDSTDARSTSLSDGNTIVPDLYGRTMRRALDIKMRSLRNLLVADEDITSEVDRVVCRLMKLALRTCRGHQNPPTAAWMLGKLFDLLTLTEKAIERRRRLFIENYPIKAIEYGDVNEKRDESLGKTIEDPVMNKIVADYQHLLSDGDDVKEDDDFKDLDDCFGNEVNDNLSVNSDESKGFENPVFYSTGLDSVSSNEKFPYDIKRLIHDTEFINNSPISLDTDTPMNNLDDVDDVLNKSSSELELVDYKTQDKLESDEENTTVTNMNLMDESEPLLYKPSRCKLVEKQRKPSKSSKTKLIKKLVGRKISPYNYLKYKTIEYSLYKAKNNRKDKEHKRLQSKSSQPIPDSLIELCNQEMLYNTNADEINLNDNSLIESVAAPQDSLFINIIMEGQEETIALERSIGTDPDTNYTFETEAMLETVINITKEENFCDKMDIETLSSTIFLYDINEPTTSKGVRQLSTDVQCGPDVSITLATLSATTSLAKIPNIFATGIKIEDSNTSIKTATKTYDYGTFIDENIITNLCDVSEIDSFRSKVITDSSTMTNVETEVIKAISSTLKIYQCISEDYSAGSLSKSANESTDIQIPGSREVLPNMSEAKYVRPKLSYGRIHVHSFKDKQASEDVVYLGEWQRDSPKALTNKLPKTSKASVKRSSYNTYRKKSDSIIKKQHTNVEENADKKSQNYISRPLSVKNSKPSSVPQKSSKNKLKTNKDSTVQKIRFRNVAKVSSKITNNVLSKSGKNVKPKLSNLKPLLTSTPTKDDWDKQKVFTVKNYLPPYLKKRIQNLSSKEGQNINQNVVCKTTFKKEKSNLTRLSTKTVTKVVTTFSDNLPENVTYLVYRNELDTEKKSANARSSIPPNEIRNNITSRRGHSPQSQHSSTCSSHNSMATVRAVSIRKINFNQKNSNSSDYSTSETIGTENKPTKTKKYFRKCKSNKKLNLIHDDIKEKIGNNTLTSRNNDIYIAQMTSDNLTSQSTSLNVCKSGGLKKSSLKIPYAKTDTATTSKIENIESNAEDFSKSSKIDLENLVQVTYNEKTLNNSSNTSQPLKNNLLHKGKVYPEKALVVVADIIEMIEARVNLYTESNCNDMDSENSGGSFESVNPDKKVEITNTLESSNSSYDTLFDNESYTTYNINESAVTDGDLISFKSITSMTTSKLSEYFLANNQPTTNMQQFYNLSQNSVRDIFDRKDLKASNNVVGVLATQAFSGFSVNAEPVSGDRPDYVNLVDSETGSLAFGATRQATSEELFVSGRSSDTYESCYFDDDSFVPNWLFNALSQQEVEDSEPEDMLMMQIPMPANEPVFDINGNVMEPNIGFGAGAGDGRGMHSDHSQDSSGRGTSLTSSETSSGQESQGVTSDPSAFNTQDEYNISETNDVPLEVVGHSLDATLVPETDNTISNRSGPHRSNRAVASDIDADVSSLDTDAVDSDN